MKKEEILVQLQAILEKAHIESNSKYLSAKQIEAEFGVNRKTILNRSNLPKSNPRYIPWVRLKGGRKKYFERKVIERMIQFGRSES